MSGTQNAYHWHAWFAWHPIADRWSDTKVTVLWLETVERRRHVDSWGQESWEYRPVRAV